MTTMLSIPQTPLLRRCCPPPLSGVSRPPVDKTTTTHCCSSTPYLSVAVEASTPPPPPSEDELSPEPQTTAMPADGLQFRGCKTCGREEIEKGCNGEGRIQGGIATVPGFGWWPIKAYRPCPGFVASGGRYRRFGQTMDEVVSGRGRREASIKKASKAQSSYRMILICNQSGCEYFCVTEDGVHPEECHLHSNCTRRQGPTDPKGGSMPVS